jgi:hypothetical protein
VNPPFIFGVNPVRKDGILTPTLSKMNVIFIIPAIDPIGYFLSNGVNGEAF